jgi:hypothetical protein
MEATYSYETSVYFHQTTRRYIAEDKDLHSHSCENLKSSSKVTVYAIDGRDSKMAEIYFINTSMLVLGPTQPLL